jgi:hypothetical protein
MVDLNDLEDLHRGAPNIEDLTLEEVDINILRLLIFSLVEMGHLCGIQKWKIPFKILQVVLKSLI